MARYTPPSSVGTLIGLKTELDKIKTAIDDTLSRKDDTPNQMETDLDMNSNQILNLPVPNSPTSPVRVQDIPNYLGQVQGSVYIGETPPVGFPGMRWYNPAIPRTYIYYEDGTSGQWVEESSESTDGGIREDLKLLNSTVQIAGVPAQTLVSRIEALEQRASVGALQSYTPVVLGNLTSGTGTYTSQVGNFYTLGDLVFFSASVTYTAHTGSGTIQVSLPSQAAAFGGRVALSVDYNTFNVGAGRQCVAFVTSGSTAATIFGADPSGGAVSNVFDTAATITISGFYRRVL